MSKKALTRWQALDLLCEINNAIVANKWGTVVQLAGLTEDLAEGLTIEEVMQCVEVRLSALTHIAGIKVDA